jgi:hypothetical protein
MAHSLVPFMLLSTPHAFEPAVLPIRNRCQDGPFRDSAPTADWNATFCPCTDDPGRIGRLLVPRRLAGSQRC